MTKRLSDEDVERIAEAVVRKMAPGMPIYPNVIINPPAVVPNYEHWWT